MHQIETPRIPHKPEQEYLATGTDDCTRNCTQTLHETVQNSASACEVHGRNNAPDKKINPALVRGYASKCDALLKAGERIRTADIHVGNVSTHPPNDSESQIIGDYEKGVPETDPCCVHDEALDQLNKNWASLPEHIKLAILALVRAGGV